MRHQLPGAHRKTRARGFLNPQHRMVLGLVSMSAAAYMLTGIYAKDPAATRRVPKGASTRERPRGGIPLPGGRPEANAEATSDTLSAAVGAAGPGVRACLDAYGADLAPWSDLATAIEVQLDGAGLARADVLDMKGAPEPFLGCLGASLGGVQWPSAGDDILLVRVPLHIRAQPVVVPLGG